MRDKSTAEQNAANRQVELISNALERAKTNEGYWLNDQSQMIAQNNYSQEQYRTESENRERSVGIK